MATLIPAIGACVSRMTTGERRLAERLEAKLDDDYRLWYDVPMGPRNTHPDFCVLHPRRGILVLEVKDWKVGSTILRANKQDWEIMGDSGPKTVINPLEQARQYAHAVVNAKSQRKLTHRFRDRRRNCNVRLAEVSAAYCCSATWRVAHASRNPTGNKRHSLETNGSN